MDYFADIIGQGKALGILRRAMATGRLSHAYLFAGPPGVGKMSAALAWARAVLVTSDPQGEIYWREGVHPDFMRIEKAEKKTLIGIEQINQELEPWLALKPYRAGRRVVIIDQAHLLSLPAANALLKTLEEPPGHAVIILVAEEQRLLETILSRCQLVRFSPLSPDELALILERRGLAPERAGQIAKLCQGSVSTALQWAEDEVWDELGAKARAHLTSLAGGSELEIFRTAEDIEKQPLLLTSLLIAMLRDIYVLQSTGLTHMLTIQANFDYYRGIKSLQIERVQSALQKIDEISRQFRGPANPLLLSINISYLLQDALK